MRNTLFIAAAWLALEMTPALSGITLSKTGPMNPPLEMPYHGGGGGP